MRRLLLLWLLLPLAGAVAGEAAADEPAAAAGFDHAPWSRLLERYVDEQGRVAYRDLAAHDRPALDGYLAALAGARPQGWSRAERIAFWLNAYNAAIFQAVLEGRTAESLLSRYGMFFRFEIEVAGEERTPDQIENGVIRPSGESRIHFALVCASSSCPRLRRRAWTADTLDADLDEAARLFVRDPARNQLRAGAESARVSKIFDWYADDFGGSGDALRAYLARYAGEAESRWLLEQQPEIEFLDYDWSLNAQPGQRP